jgi:hypothetical protein
MDLLRPSHGRLVLHIGGFLSRLAKKKPIGLERGGRSGGLS